MTTGPTRILIVDDDRSVLESMTPWLTDQGHSVKAAAGYDEALSLLQEDEFQLVLLDIRLGSRSGLELLPHCRATPVILMSGYATLETGIQALRAGAVDLLTKPLMDEELDNAMQLALSRREVENIKPPGLTTRAKPSNPVIGEDLSLRKTFEVIETIADTKATILITGESGTGKSLIARSIHQQSARRDRPFIEVACGALTETLLESELFGHAEGSFTGAIADKEGKFSQADGGTLFLDEISTASPGMQIKLLRVLQDFEFEPVGGVRTERVDTRVILATNENLAAAVQEGTFRRDLFYRINVINLELPTLSRRQGDIEPLCDYFVDLVCAETGKDPVAFSQEAMAALKAYSWPGNVRELRNVVERAVLLSGGGSIEIADLPDDLRSTEDSRSPAYSHGQTLKQALEGPEREIIRNVLEAFSWNRSQTAELLGINRTTLYKKMKRLGLDRGYDAALVSNWTAESDGSGLVGA